MSERWSIGLALVLVFECLLLLIAFAGYGTQGDTGQDVPIALGAILIEILVAGNAVGLFTALVIYEFMLRKKRRQP